MTWNTSTNTNMEITPANDQSDCAYFVTASSLNPHAMKYGTLKKGLHSDSTGNCDITVPMTNNHGAVDSDWLNNYEKVDLPDSNVGTFHGSKKISYRAQMDTGIINPSKITPVLSEHHAPQSLLEETTHGRNSDKGHCGYISDNCNDPSVFDLLLDTRCNTSHDMDSRCNAMNIDPKCSTTNNYSRLQCNATNVQDSRCNTMNINPMCSINNNYTSLQCNATNVQLGDGNEEILSPSVSLSQSQVISCSCLTHSSSEKNDSQGSLFLAVINSCNNKVDQELSKINTDKIDSTIFDMKEQSMAPIINQSNDVMAQKDFSDPKAHPIAFHLNEKEISELYEFGHTNSNCIYHSHHKALETIPLATPTTSRQNIASLRHLEKKPYENAYKILHNSQENNLNYLQSGNSLNSGHIESQQHEVDAVFLKSCKCRICQQGFSDVFSLNFHIFKVHEKTSRPICMRCSTKFVTLRSLLHHLKRHRSRFLSNQTVMTPEKGQRFWSHHNSMSTTLNFGTDRENLTGQERGEKLLQQGMEKRSTFHCGECGNEYKHKKTLMNHVRFKHYGLPKKMHRCSHCFRSFSSLWQMKNHAAWWHFGRKPYICEFCEKGFICLPTLKRHQRKLHTGEKPYGCACCGERFFEKVTLDLHKAQIHTGIFPFICSQCGRGFVQRCFLKNHLKIHSNVRPYKCPDCGKQYSKISHLKRHKISCAKKNAGRKVSET